MSAPAPRIFITGIGAITPHGKGVPLFWEKLLAGQSGIKPITLFDAKVFRNPAAGEVEGYPSGQPESRSVNMFRDAAKEALADALGVAVNTSDQDLKTQLGKVDSLYRMSIVSGTNFGGMSVVENALVPGTPGATDGNLSGYLFGRAGEVVAKTYGLQGSQHSLSLSCASGTAVIGVGMDLIRNGYADAVLCGGFDELSLYVYAGLSALHAITPETIRPFDKRRKGTQFSEGAGVVLLESEASIQKRGAKKIYARVAGRAMNNDAFHMTAPEQEARGIQALMRAALKDAQVAPEAVEHANLHATGTPYNDKIETKALHGVLGERASKLPVCSIKSSIGHTMGAAGTLESIAALLTLRDGKIPPILGLEPAEKDPECDLLTPTGVPYEGNFQTILKTSYGFGGTNAAVVFSKT
jgi:3-oxoacyl-(acyl-carrier-protein) synthase